MLVIPSILLMVRGLRLIIILSGLTLAPRLKFAPLVKLSLLLMPIVKRVLVVIMSASCLCTCLLRLALVFHLAVLSPGIMSKPAINALVLLVVPVIYLPLRRLRLLSPSLRILMAPTLIAIRSAKSA